MVTSRRPIPEGARIAALFRRVERDGCEEARRLALVRSPLSRLACLGMAVRFRRQRSFRDLWLYQARQVAR